MLKKQKWFLYNCCSLTPDGLDLVKWEQEFLGVELIESQFPGAGVGVATSAATTIKKVKVHCCPSSLLCKQHFFVVHCVFSEVCHNKYTTRLVFEIRLGV